jgi:hypothetical protein
MPRIQKITITDDHVLLLNRLYFDWDDEAYYGAPAVNIKRPYGNSDVFGDVAEILGWQWYDEDEDNDMPDEIEQRCEKIHREMADVLQVLVQNPTTFSTGVWVNTSPGAPYSVRYTKADD